MAYRKSVNTDLFSNSSLAKSHFQHERNLVSLYIGKLFIGIHKCSFDLFDSFWQRLTYLSLPFSA
ncbi:MAG: hypothetical protein WBB55_09005, partial [Anaerolineales bacterium]